MELQTTNTVTTSREIMVSVCCITYNQEKYLRQCLDGFVMQKTDFPFEILVNDDASTDKTADIIREYEAKYPGLVRGIFHEENQYSKGVWPEYFPFTQAKGKYIAMCEGDDFWCDPLKIQKQYDVMEANPSCQMCVHRVERIDEEGKSFGTYYPPISEPSCVIPSREFIRRICGSYCFHTSSYFVAAEEMQKYMKNPPAYTRIVEEAGDEKKFLYFGQLGDVYYLDDVMSCRREASIGSWTSGHSHLTWQQQLIRIRDLGEMMKSYDAYTEYRYHDICQARIDNSLQGQFGILNTQKQYRSLWNKEYRLLRKNWSMKYRALMAWKTLGSIFRKK